MGMKESMYAAVAYAMRYWFAFLSALALASALVWLRRDRAARLRAVEGLPDAGMIGEWAVLCEGETPRMLETPPDGWLGSGRLCDVRHKGLPRLAARFALHADGLHLVPLRPNLICVDGVPVRRLAVLRHGAVLSCRGVTLQLRLFAGVLLKGETPAPFPAEGGVNCHD